MAALMKFTFIVGARISLHARLLASWVVDCCLKVTAARIIYAFVIRAASPGLVLIHALGMRFTIA